MCINPLDLKAYSGAIGLPIPSTEVELRDDSGKEVGIGEVGELCVRGPQVMKGYWQRPDETAKVIGPDGWLRHRRHRHDGRQAGSSASSTARRT